MNSQKELLAESRDSWQESANHDRSQLISSFAIAATGITLVGVGIGTMLKGDVSSGSLEIVVGAGLAVPSIKTGLSEIQNYAEMTAKAAVMQSQIEHLDNS